MEEPFVDSPRPRLQCLNCERSVAEVPLISIAHRDGTAYICPQCLPVLIHRPYVFAGKLGGVESLLPPEH